MAENVFIDKDELSRAAAMAESRTTPDGKKVYIFTDKGVKGLRLSVQTNKASWIVRWDNTSKVLGYHYPADDTKSITVNQARELAQAALRLLKAGKKAEVDGLITAFHEQRRGKKSVIKAIDDLVPDVKTWTLRKCFEQTIEDKRLPGAKNPIGDEMEKDMRITMNRSCFQTILDKPAALVTIGDIEKVRDDVYKELQAKGKKGVSPSNKVIAHTRAVYEHCASHNRAASGIDPEKPWWKMLATRFANPKRTRRPELEDVVRTLILAEEYLSKPLPGRSINVPGTNAGTLAGLWWLVLTVQRATAGLTLLPYNIGEDLERPHSGWLLAAWDETEQKGGASFVLPVPKRAWDFVDSFRQKNKNVGSTEWLFPSESDPEKHATPSGVYRIIYRLAGRDEVEQKKPEQTREEDKKKRKKPQRTARRDLLEELEIDFWSPHDLRRTLTAFMIVNKMPGAASAILAHEVDEKESLWASSTAQSRSNFREQQMKRITQMAYAGGDAGAQLIELKSKAMELWTNAVIDCYEELTGIGEKRRSEKHHRELMRTIYDDARSVERARKRAVEDVNRQEQDLIELIERDKRHISSQHVVDLARLKGTEFDFESQLETLRGNREQAILTASRAAANRTFLGIKIQGRPDVDLQRDAPEYEAVRDRVISGEIDYETFKSIVSDMYNLDLESGLEKDSIYRDPVSVAE